MPRPTLPERSDSTRTAGAPHDATAPDERAIEDVYKSVEETGSLEAAARKLQQVAIQRAQAQAWEDDPEEAAYLAQHQAGAARYGDVVEEEVEDGVADDEDVQEEEGDGVEAADEVVHLQEVIDGLWIGDLVAAMDVPGLEERGITNILSLLRPRLSFADKYAVYPLEIDDSADTDILTHLPSCVAWIQEALEKRKRSVDPEFAISNPPQSSRDKSIDKLAQDPNPGGILVHCQAGMSRSATVVAAYLMRALDLDPMDAVEMLKEKRPVVDPSNTFWYQLGLFYNADGKVSLRDRSTRQFYMERTTSQFMNGDGGAPPMDKMAKFPASPTPSHPATPMGGHGRRKIRCKMCRRHLAVREHMMDHILDQSPVSRPRTPSLISLPSPRISFSNAAGFTSPQDEVTRDSTRERRTSVVSDVINPLTGLPGAVRSRNASMSSAAPSPITGGFTEIRSSGDEPQLSPGGVPLPRTQTPGLMLTSSSPENATAPRLISEILPGKDISSTPQNISRPQSAEPSPPTTSNGRVYRSAEELNSRLPPHLQALRNAGSSSTLSSPFNISPTSSPEKETSPQVPHHVFPPMNGPKADVGRSRSQSSSSQTGGSGSISRRKSLLAMTPAGGPERMGSLSGDHGMAASGPPILVNPKCSGYFVEPLTWMEPFLAKGDIAGKIVCPNEKCGAKIGNYDWAGVQCGCKDWVTPGFCISRSKVDEVW